MSSGEAIERSAELQLIADILWLQEQYPAEFIDAWGYYVAPNSGMVLEMVHRLLPRDDDSSEISHERYRLDLFADNNDGQAMETIVIDDHDVVTAATLPDNDRNPETGEIDAPNMEPVDFEAIKYIGLLACDALMPHFMNPEVIKNNLLGLSDAHPKAGERAAKYLVKLLQTATSHQNVDSKNIISIDDKEVVIKSTVTPDGVFDLVVTYSLQSSDSADTVHEWNLNGDEEDEAPTKEELIVLRELVDQLLASVPTA